MASMAEKINLSDIKVVSVYLPDEEKWIDRKNDAIAYFDSVGLKDILWVCGIHAEKFGVKASRPYRRDIPNTDYTVEPRTVGGYLSWYMVFNIILSHPEWEYFMILEDDTRFNDNWQDSLKKGLENVPEDFDMLVASHCCTDGREVNHIKGNVYEVKYPLACHCTIVNSKCLPLIISKMRNACIPSDIHFFDEINQYLKLYTILPRIAEQHDTYLPL